MRGPLGAFAPWRALGRLAVADEAVQEPAQQDIDAQTAHDAVEACGGLIGAVEACELLGIPWTSRGNLYSLEGLPRHLGRTRSGRVWLMCEMQAFAVSRPTRSRSGDEGRSLGDVLLDHVDGEWRSARVLADRAGVSPRAAPSALRFLVAREAVLERVVDADADGKGWAAREYRRADA
jgi:hypothetical protein